MSVDCIYLCTAWDVAYNQQDVRIIYTLPTLCREDLTSVW